MTCPSAVAALEGVDPIDLDFTLYDHIYPDALDTLIQSGNVTITFTVAQYDIHVTPSGTIRITS
ncbi:HalOD1 output domain-containing protein [Natronorubrum sp. FCH18a]|uniref:HalOD1 output domain-containing protein n=1 Tax=Natronorubrum sp. FCH18a TaxID=3447018 RepID=UPI003F50DA13